MIHAIWYHLACNFTKSNTLAWVFFKFSKLYKLIQISQRITYGQLKPVKNKMTVSYNAGQLFLCLVAEKHAPGRCFSYETKTGDVVTCIKQAPPINFWILKIYENLLLATRSLFTWDPKWTQTGLKSQTALKCRSVYMAIYMEISLRQLSKQ